MHYVGAVMTIVFYSGPMSALTYNATLHHTQLVLTNIVQAS
jgi:hypothetical protein